MLMGGQDSCLPACLPHLVKLVNADHPSIRQNHGPPLHDEVAGHRVPHDAGCEPSGTAALPRCVHLVRGTRHEQSLEGRMAVNLLQLEPLSLRT